MASKSQLAAEIQALNDVLAALDGLDDLEKIWVLQTAASRIGPPVVPVAAQPLGVSSESSVKLSPEMAPKDFMRVKGPESDVHRIACLAYYLTHYRDTPHFKSRDLTILNTEAAGSKINMSRGVNNATGQSGYLAAAGSGKKQITARGEEIVGALPNKEAVQEIDSAKRPRRRKAKSRKKSSRRKVK